MALVAGVIASAAPAPITMRDEQERPEAAAGPEHREEREAHGRRWRAPRRRRACARSAPTACPRPRTIGRITMLIGSSATAAVQRAVPEHELQELQRDEEEAEHREELEEQRRGAGGEARGAGTAAGRAAAASVRSSTSTNVAQEHDAADERRSSVTGSVQPRSGPSMMPSTRRPMPTADTIEPADRAPTCSSAWWWGRRGSRPRARRRRARR